MIPEIHGNGRHLDRPTGAPQILQYEMLNYLISLLHAVKKIVVKVLDCLLVGALCPVLRPCASLPAKVVTLWLPP